MDKSDFCVLPEQILHTFRYLRAAKGEAYACNFIDDILQYGLYENPIENDYPEVQVSRIQLLMNQMKSPYLRMGQGGRKSTLDDDKIKELYENGLPIIQIAKQLNCSTATIKRHLLKIGCIPNNEPYF